MTLSAKELGYKKLNEVINQSSEDIIINECFGERFIGCGTSNKKIQINGVPGNALGAYLDGAEIVVNGNVQDAVGDTMNSGSIVVHGNAGDALGYAMRGGHIFIKGDSGYRTGIHMKQYKDMFPTVVIGGKAGSFLGEYMAGGLLIILGINCDAFPVDVYTGTGMHGGEIWIRSEKEPPQFSAKVSVEKADLSQLSKITPYIKEYCEHFSVDINSVLSTPFYKITPDAKNPYKRLYTEN